MEGEIEVGKKQRKIFKVGDSKVVSLPPEFLKQHDIKEGDEVEVLFNDIVQIEAVDEENVHKEMERRNLKRRKSRIEVMKIYPKAGEQSLSSGRVRPQDPFRLVMCPFAVINITITTTTASGGMSGGR